MARAATTSVSKKKVAARPKKSAAKKKTVAGKKVAAKKKPVAAKKKPAAAKKKPAAAKKKPVAAKKKPAAAKKKPVAAKKKRSAHKAATKKKTSATRAKVGTRKKTAAKSSAKKKTPAKTKAAAVIKPKAARKSASKRGDEYMNPKQAENFRQLLVSWRIELMEEVDRTVHHMQDDASNFPDPNDRATQEEEFALELRTRDRERKLIKKINESLSDLDTGDYGYCEVCGVEIGVQRLQARPTATLCIDCKTLDEIREKQGN